MNEYLGIYQNHLLKLNELVAKKREIEAEIAKVRQMLRATYNLVPEDEKKSFADVMHSAMQFIEEEEKGLTEAIRSILQTKPREWFTAIQVRDRLQESGFNFSAYTSNPLSSIHSVLKRFKRNEVKMKELLDGTKQYRWIKKPPSLRGLYGLEPFPAVRTTVPLRALAGKIDSGKEKK